MNKKFSSGGHLIVLMGFPASGKSTLRKELLKELKDTFEVYSLDDRMSAYDLEGKSRKEVNDIRKKEYKKMNLDIRERMKTGKNILIDGTNLTEKTRKAKIAWVNSINPIYTSTLIHVTTPYGISFARNELRDSKTKVPEKDYELMAKYYSPPTYEEGWSKIIEYPTT